MREPSTKVSPKGQIRIGVLSDTHHDDWGIRWAMERLQSEAELDALCFLGDCTSDIPQIERCITQGNRVSLHAVRGNNDVLAHYPNDTLLSLGGKKILLTHGHTHRVKMHRLNLLLYAEELGADVALFGHTHAQECAYEHGILLLNPGAASGAHPSCALLIIEGGTFYPRQFQL